MSTISAHNSASGGPVPYTGRDMRTAHAGLNSIVNNFNPLVHGTCEVTQFEQCSSGGAANPAGGLGVRSETHNRFEAGACGGGDASDVWTRNGGIW